MVWSQISPYAVTRDRRIDSGILRLRVVSRAVQHEVHCSTCTLASPVTNWIGRCCESLAFICTMDSLLVPGPSALITMPRIVPVPLAPAVFG